jgi:hypothetical protein
MVDEMPVAGTATAHRSSYFGRLSIAILPGIWIPASYRTSVRLEPKLVPAVAIVNAEATTSTATGSMRRLFLPVH